MCTNRDRGPFCPSAVQQGKEAHLEVLEQDVREVGSLDKPAVWDNLSLQPLDHTTPQLIAVSSIADHCRGGNISIGHSINK